GNDDHLLLAVDDEEVAILVHANDVARVQPAVPQRKGRLVRSAPITVHQVRPTNAELPGLARIDLARAGLDVDDLALDVRHRDTDRPRLARSLARVRVR